SLVFTTLYESAFDMGYSMIVMFAFLLLLLMVLINKGLAKLFGWPQSVESASILTSAFMNSGNYGVPVILFSVGKAALPYVVFFMVLQSLIMNVFGVYYASRSTSGISQALQTVLKMPATYAAILAFTLQSISWEIPAPIYSTLTMLSDASIPLMMVLLGMQLASSTSLRLNGQVMASAAVVRMVISPLMAFLFIWLVDADPVVEAVL